MIADRVGAHPGGVYDGGGCISDLDTAHAMHKRRGTLVVPEMGRWTVQHCAADVASSSLRKADATNAFLRVRASVVVGEIVISPYFTAPGSGDLPASRTKTHRAMSQKHIQKVPNRHGIEEFEER